MRRRQATVVGRTLTPRYQMSARDTRRQARPGPPSGQGPAGTIRLSPCSPATSMTSTAVVAAHGRRDKNLESRSAGPPQDRGESTCVVDLSQRPGYESPQPGQVFHYWMSLEKLDGSTIRGTGGDARRSS